MDPVYSGPERKTREARAGVSRRLPDIEARIQEDPFFCRRLTLAKLAEQGARGALNPAERHGRGLG